MKNRLFMVASLALAIIGVSGSASAATVNFGSGASYTVSDSDDYVAGNIDLNSLAHSTSPITSVYELPQAHLVLFDARITSGPTQSAGNPELYSTPPEQISANDNYIAIFGNDLSAPFSDRSGAAIFSVSSNDNYFAFEWGTLDDYNTVSYIDGNNQRHTITGAEIIAIANANDFGNDIFFELFDPSGIKSVILGSVGVAMEVAHITLSNIPLPPALLLFGAALSGLFGFRSRKSLGAVA